MDYEDFLMLPPMYFFGGFSTISLTVGFMCHELALHDDIQNRLYQEVAEADRQLNGEQIGYTALHELNYLDAVLKETMRVWLVAGSTDRVVNKPYVIENYDGTRVQLNVGDTVMIPLDAIAHDSAYFPDPDRFDPNRFTAENIDNMAAKNAYMPFGHGRRSCVAQVFASMVCKAIMYYVVLNFRLERCDRTQDPMKLDLKSLTLEPEAGMWLKLQLRNSVCKTELK